ncbi:DUF2567 domain-containing protein [Nocardia sp. NPDC050710]|uniref:DUF2567 domain-containing protein n=1 Tax=Nocardia sp. NPDC050710 TaxID=3157220 RepID=UPI003409D6ED
MRRELAAGLLTVGAVVAFSLIGGVVWGCLAPTEQLLVTQPGRGAALTGESAHQFDALAIFVCIGAVVGLLSAVGAWRLRAARGPILQVGLLIGSVAGAFGMQAFGEAVAAWQHPRADDPPVGQIIALAPEVGSSLALIVQPLIASLVLLFLAALSPSEDLGTGFSGPFGSNRPFEQYVPDIAEKAEPAGPAIPYGVATNGAGGAYGGYGPADGASSVPESRTAR